MWCIRIKCDCRYVAIMNIVYIEELSCQFISLQKLHHPLWCYRENFDRIMENSGSNIRLNERIQIVNTFVPRNVLPLSIASETWSKLVGMLIRFCPSDPFDTLRDSRYNSNSNRMDFLSSSYRSKLAFSSGLLSTNSSSSSSSPEWTLLMIPDDMMRW